MSETRPGWRTTEFWLVVLGNLLINVGALDVGGAKYRGLFAILSVVGYSLARGLAKSGVPDGGFAPQVPIGDEGDLGDDSDDVPVLKDAVLQPAVHNVHSVQASPGTFSTSAGPEPEGVPKSPESSGD